LIVARNEGGCVLAGRARNRTGGGVLGACVIPLVSFSSFLNCFFCCFKRDTPSDIPSWRLVHAGRSRRERPIPLLVDARRCSTTFAKAEAPDHSQASANECSRFVYDEPLLRLDGSLRVGGSCAPVQIGRTRRWQEDSMVGRERREFVSGEMMTDQ
jgi:hypothetical protein